MYFQAFILDVYFLIYLYRLHKALSELSQNLKFCMMYDVSLMLHGSRNNTEEGLVELRIRECELVTHHKSLINRWN